MSKLKPIAGLFGDSIEAFEKLLPPKYRFRFEVVTDEDEVIALAEDCDIDMLIQKIGSIERDIQKPSNTIIE